MSFHRLLGAGLGLALFAVTAPVYAIDVAEVKSKDGITAYLAEDHTNPIIAFSFQFRGGATLDPVDKLGLSNMVSGLLDEGAGDMESFAFQSQLEDLAIRLSFDAEECGSTASSDTS